MKLFEHDKTERTLEQLPEMPPGVEVPDDISGLGPPTTLKPTAGGVRWMRWLAAIVVVGAAGLLTAQLLSSSDSDQVAADDYMARYGTDNPVFVQEGAVAGTAEIADTVDYMEVYGTDNPAFVPGTSEYGTDTPAAVLGTWYVDLYAADTPAAVLGTWYVDLYGTDTPAAVLGTWYVDLYGTDTPATSYMELYGTDNPVFVPNTSYMDLYGTDNPAFVEPTPTE